MFNKEKNEKEKLTRYYHPLSKVTDNGCIDLLVKVYLQNLQFPKGGLFSQHIDRIQEGEKLHITGILGDVVYQGNSNFLLRNRETGLMEPKKWKNVGMIAAGSGITPMF